MKEEIEGWRKATGIDFISRPDQDVLKNVIEMSAKDMARLELRDLDEVMLILANYLIYLSSQLGIISAKVSFLDGELSKRIAPVASKYTAGSFIERKSIALNRGDDDLRKLDSHASSERIKLEMLRPICDAVKVKIDIIRRIYDRRARERN